MSLLTRGPHTVVLWTVETTDELDANGDPLVLKTPTTIKNCSMRPLSTEEVVSYGATFADTHYQLTHVNWAGVMGSKVEWDGLTFEQIGQTQRHGRGVRTKHTTAHLRMLPTSKVR
jgi:hypothetical protein